MNRYKHLPNYRYYDANGDSITIKKSIGKPLRNYRIYGNSIQNGTPSIENPIDVQSVGDKTKNLFDEDLITETGLYEKNENGYLALGYSVVFSSTTNLVKHLKSVLKADTQYTLSRIVSGVPASGFVGGRIQIRDGSNTNLVICTHGNGLKKITFTLTQEQIDSINNVVIYGGNSTYPVTYEYIQIEEGDEATEHDIYNKYRITIKNKGINVFDINELGTTNIIKNADEHYFDITAYSVPTGINPSEFLEMTGLKIGDTFTISTKVEILKGNTTANNNIVFLTKSSSKTINVMSSSKTVNSVTIPEDFNDDNYYGLYVYGVRNADENGERLVRYSNFMIVKGEYTEETLPKYEPYKEPVITEIYLDEPLRKTGDYTDYLDFKNKKVVRNVHQDYIKTMHLNANATETTNGLYYRFFVCDNYDITMVSGTRITGYSNVLPSNVETWNNWTKEQFQFGQKNSRIYLITNDPHDGESGDREKFCEYLSNGGITDPYVIYPISTPIEEEIELPEILTNKGTNIIEIETTIQPSNIAVTYLGKKIEVTTSLTEEQINAINNMNITTDNGEIIINYDDETLDFDFKKENESLIVENNVNELDFNINENGEMEVSY